MKLTSIAIVSGLLWASAMSASSLGHFTAGPMPSSYGNCEALKPKVAEAFSRASGADIVSTDCHGSADGTVVTITYIENGAPIEFSTTRARSVTDDIAGRGYIKTQNECETRKDSVAETFKIATGLTPFLVHCMEDEAANSSTLPWHVAIEAIGVGQMNYQFIDRMLSDGLSTDPEALTTEIKNYFNSRPDTVLVASVYRMDNIGFAHVSAALFTKKRVSVNKYEFLSTRREKDCAFEAEELKAAANRSGMPVVGHGCQVRGQNYHKTFLIAETHDKLSFDSTGIKYESMEACRSARTNVYEDMRRRVGDSVVGVHCSDGTDEPTAYIILKPEV